MVLGSAMSVAMTRCRRSYNRAPRTEGVAAVDRVNRGRTTSRNGRAGRCHHCSALQRTGVNGRPSQRRHLSGYPNDAWASRVLIGWLIYWFVLGLADDVESCAFTHEGTDNDIRCNRKTHYWVAWHNDCSTQWQQQYNTWIGIDNTPRFLKLSNTAKMRRSQWPLDGANELCWSCIPNDCFKWKLISYGHKVFWQLNFKLFFRSKGVNLLSSIFFPVTVLSLNL